MTDSNTNQAEEQTAQFQALEEEVERLRKHNTRILDERKRDQEEARKASAEAEQLKRDTEALERSWAEKLNSTEQQLQAEIERRDSWLKDMTAGRAAETMAADLAVKGSAGVLAKLIQGRLTSQIRDGKPVALVLDAQGHPSAATLDDLKAEIQNDPAYAPMLRGNLASGSGAINGRAGAHRGPKRSAMNVREKAAYVERHGIDAYEQLPR